MSLLQYISKFFQTPSYETERQLLNTLELPQLCNQSDEALHRVRNVGVFNDLLLLAKLKKEKFESPQDPSDKSEIITVDYNQTFLRKLSDCQFDFCDRQFNEDNFGILRVDVSIRYAVKLLSSYGNNFFGGEQKITYYRDIKRMTEYPWIFGRTEHLLAYVAYRFNADIGIAVPIISLGSSCMVQVPRVRG